MSYGTILVDPPWPYQRAGQHDRLTGYSNYEYDPLDAEALRALPVGEVASEDAVLLLWATWPMMPLALEMIQAWGFLFITGLPWVKTAGLEEVGDTGLGGEQLRFKPFYGVGYWFRGCTEPLLIAKRPGAPSVRTPWVGLLCDRAEHSRKPDSVYELAESFPGPRLELFARRKQAGWEALGDALDGRDIRESLEALR